MNNFIADILDASRVMDLTREMPDVTIVLNDSGWHVKYNGSEIMHTRNSSEITLESIFANNNNTIKEQRRQLIREL